MKWFSDLTNVLKLLGVALIALIIWVAFKGFQRTVLLGKDGIPDKISEVFRQKTSKEQFRIYLDYWAVRAKWFFLGSYPKLSNEQVKQLRNENKNLGSFVG
ncbi:hypothetical protein, partial [Ornithobacterium rhinotracheale]|uniref:hypothetical protein n=1 Tax=Ornithobacterium rhinotracheale TaxID=28251 RepID=UPI004039F277